MINRLDTLTLKKLRETLDNNIINSEAVNDFIMNADSIIDIETIQCHCEDYQLSSSESIKEYFDYVYDLDSNIEVVKLNEKEYLENPYYKNIKVKPIKFGKYELTYQSYFKYQPILCDSLSVDQNYNEIIKVGHFDHNTKFKSLTLTENNNIWMNITPHEIKTMEKCIQNSTGNCLVHGLGLGYFAYMISNKEDVKSVTIIEKDKNIIDIFNKYIFPFFVNKDKIKIINIDAFEYNYFENIDYCFIDIYRDTVDGLPIYLKFKQQEKPNIKYDYWIEESMLIAIRRYLILELIGEKANDKSSISLMNIFKNQTFTSLEDLSNASIINCIKKCMD